MRKISQFILMSAFTCVPINLYAFWAGGLVVSHAQITRDALPKVTATFGGKKFHFRREVIQEIAKANYDVDTKPASIPWEHFDDNEFAASKRNIDGKKEKILIKLRANNADGTDARRLLGELLHTLQDFYSHSSWIEKGKSKFNTSLEISGDLPNPEPAQTIGNAAVGAHYTSLQTGQYPHGTDELGVVKDNCDAFRLKENEVLHGSRFFGLKVPQSLLDSLAKKGIPTTQCDGLNKDHFHRPNSGLARKFATDATTHFVQTQIVDVLVKENKPKAICKLFGLPSALYSELCDSKCTPGFVPGMYEKEIHEGDTILNFRLTVGNDGVWKRILVDTTYSDGSGRTESLINHGATIEWDRGLSSYTYNLLDLETYRDDYAFINGIDYDPLSLEPDYPDFFWSAWTIGDNEDIYWSIKMFYEFSFYGHTHERISNLYFYPTQESCVLDGHVYGGLGIGAGPHLFQFLTLQPEEPSERENGNRLELIWIWGPVLLEKKG